jgi:LysM repeat protein
VSYAFEFVEDESRPLTSGAAVSTGSNSGQTGSSRTYTVKKGDSLWRIAKMYNLTLNQIIKLNPQIKNPNLIYVGQTVYVA